MFQTPTTSESLADLCEKVHIKVSWGASKSWDLMDEWQRQANGFRCTLRYQGRQYTFDFWQGVGIEREPTAYSILCCLLSDARCSEYKFVEFCAELGYDEDSRKAYRSWKECRKIYSNLLRLLGDDFETFLYAEE